MPYTLSNSEIPDVYDIVPAPRYSNIFRWISDTEDAIGVPKMVLLCWINILDEFLYLFIVEFNMSIVASRNKLSTVWTVIEALNCVVVQLVHRPSLDMGRQQIFIQDSQSA